MKTPLLLLAAAMVFASCSHSPEVPTNKNDILEVEEVWLDDIATDIEVQPIVCDYPLETFLIICGSDSVFVALDENVQTLYYVVDNRVVSKLKTIGRGPREYRNITGIAYSAVDKTLYAYSPDRQSIYCYKMPGFEFAGKRDLKQDVNAMILLDDKNLLLTGYDYDSCANSGIYRYTIGQRKGLGLSLGHPVYVNRLDADSNRVIVGEESELYSQTVFCKDVHFMGIENLAQGEQIMADVKVRYAHQPQPAQAQMLSGGVLKITFEKPVRAAAPGQSAVLYDKDRCILCGGIITHTSNTT